MDKLDGLVTAASQLTKYDLMSMYNQAKNVVLTVSEMEAKVREVTNNDPWGTSSKLMQEIAQGTFNFQEFNKIMPYIYSQFIEKEAKEWRQIYKALQLLEYIIRHGSERVVNDARSHLSTIKMLRNFHYIDEKGRDQGINVRNRSNELAELLQDLDRVRQERQKAKTNRNRDTGAGDDGASNAQAQPPTKTTATLKRSDEAPGGQSAGRAATTRGTSNSALPNPSRQSRIETPSSSQMAATATSNAKFGPILGDIPQQPLALPSEKLSVTPASINVTESQSTTSQDVQIHNVGTVAHRGPEDNPIENSSEGKDIRWNTFLTQEVGRCGQYKLRGSDPVAHGGFSDILLGDVQLPTGIQPVAVKRLRFSGSPDSDNVLQKLEKRLTKELTIWMALQHPNIAPLLGHARTPAMCLISPWFRKGNLASFIKAEPSENRTNLVKGIAEGLAYLHRRTPAIVHGDIKPDNILINESGAPVLIDFGLSKTLESDPDLASYSCTSLRDAGNTRWIAPEFLLQDGVSRSCSTDVYSFGCLAFFTFTGDVPFKGLDGPRLVAARCIENTQPIPPGATYPVLDAMFGIMEMLSACWLEKPLERPTMLSITQQPPLSQL